MGHKHTESRVIDGRIFHAGTRFASKTDANKSAAALRASGCLVRLEKLVSKETLRAKGWSRAYQLWYSKR